MYECSCIAEFLSCVFPSFSSASVTTFLKFFKLFKYFKYSPSSHVLAPCVVESFQVFRLYSSKLQVYKLLAPTMAEAVIVRSLDLVDSYYTLSVSSLH